MDLGAPMKHYFPSVLDTMLGPSEGKDLSMFTKALGLSFAVCTRVKGETSGLAR